MKTKASIIVVIVSVFVFLVGCASDKSGAGSKAGSIQTTVPNGSSPELANAARAPMNDSEATRKAFNHGNGFLWVLLPADGTITVDAAAQKDSNSNFKGWHRFKFGWWRGIRGEFTITGKRLDAPAPPLRFSIHADSYGDLGFMPSYVYFPSEGYWEITGHIGSESLTFVVRVVSEKN